MNTTLHVVNLMTLDNFILALSQGFSTGRKFTPWGKILPILGVNVMMLKLHVLCFFLQR